MRLSPVVVAAAAAHTRLRRADERHLGSLLGGDHAPFEHLADPADVAAEVHNARVRDEDVELGPTTRGSNASQMLPSLLREYTRLLPDVPLTCSSRTAASRQRLCAQRPGSRDRVRRQRAVARRAAQPPERACCRACASCGDRRMTPARSPNSLGRRSGSPAVAKCGREISLLFRALVRAQLADAAHWLQNGPPSACVEKYGPAKTLAGRGLGK